MTEKIKRGLLIIVTVLILAAVAASVAVGAVYTATQVDIAEIVEIPIIRLDEKYKNDVYRVNKYSGHPDLVLNGGGELITVFPEGHGKGAVMTFSSNDFGATWDRRENTPKSWEKSQETPTIYRLDFRDGSHKIILVSGCPLWAGDPTYEKNGFNFSYSSDEGATWSEFENFYGKAWASEMQGREPFDCIVAMSSLTRIKENGEYIDKWMGTFHDRNFDNYRTYLTFEDGVARWSEPELILGDWNEIGRREELCELEIVRVETGELVMLARSNTHKGSSFACVSEDEGATWSKPAELPYALSGDRHKAEYDATTGKWLVSFRQVLPYAPNALSSAKICGAGWVAWVGDDEVLLSLAKGDRGKGCGDALIVICENYKNNLDCGYSGTAVKDGVFCLVSYGYFDYALSYPFILGAKFRLKDVLPNL